MPAIRAYPRDFFLDRVWRYRTGEHVTLLGPTNSGKTHLAHQLLATTATEKVPVVDLVMKPKDLTTKKFMKANHFRRTRDWPAKSDLWHPSRPAGYVLWPRHRFDPDIDDPAHYAIFRRAILDSYKRGKRIVFADELYSLVHELGLRRELITVWTKGRSMDCGLWGASQRPRDVPLHAYSQAEHLFLAFDPTKDARERFGEIGGVDARMVASAVKQLPHQWWLYIRREDRVMCVIQK